jgi:hypothetical protein
MELVQRLATSSLDQFMEELGGPSKVAELMGKKKRLELDVTVCTPMSRGYLRQAATTRLKHLLEEVACVLQEEGRHHL